MKVTDNFEIKPDNAGWVLIYTDTGINKKTGKPKRVEQRTYYTTMEIALKRIVDQKMHKDGAETIEAVLASVRVVNEAIERLCKKK